MAVLHTQRLSQLDATLRFACNKTSHTLQKHAACVREYAARPPHTTPHATVTHTVTHRTQSHDTQRCHMSHMHTRVTCDMHTVTLVSRSQGLDLGSTCGISALGSPRAMICFALIPAFCNQPRLSLYSLQPHQSPESTASGPEL
eukprot:586031-Rhodomonas_salina.2